jgi:hypothetical protein
MNQPKSELRALEYRERARHAHAAADACILDRAREQHIMSATRWTEMAEDQERRNIGSRIYLGPPDTAQEP